MDRRTSSKPSLSVSVSPVSIPKSIIRRLTGAFRQLMGKNIGKRQVRQRLPRALLADVLGDTGLLHATLDDRGRRPPRFEGPWLATDPTLPCGVPGGPPKRPPAD
ncbi:hypothetical protein [Roseibium sp.]|uniref:hypothetical protein n=1 Tax=Roseibium sp. TaxID=1936156 RepID=UPI00326476BB